MKVLVLMSTYNGERFLREQIDSILCQKGVEVSLIVRDDGSSDGTIHILDGYRKEGKLEWYQGENIRPAMSFLNLMKIAAGYKYYSFADQDDFWMPDKLYSAVVKLEEYDGPALYFSQTQLTDKQLNPIKTPSLTPLLSFGESLVYAFATGCTMVLNNKLKDIMVANTPNGIEMHDIWIYNVAKAINANVVFDREPHILYRQHETNVIGLNHGFIFEMQLRLKRIFQNSEIRSRKARMLMKCCNDIISQQNVSILQLFVSAKYSLKARIKLLFDSRFKCGDVKTHILFRLAVLLNTY